MIFRKGILSRKKDKGIRKGEETEGVHYIDRYIGAFKFTDNQKGFMYARARSRVLRPRQLATARHNEIATAANVLAASRAVMR